MTDTAFPHRRRHTPVIALITAMLALFVVPAPAAAVEPTTPPHEDGSKSLTVLRQNLAAATAGYIKAESELDASVAKQTELQKQLSAAEADIARVQGRVAGYAAEAYKTGRLGVLRVVLQAGSQDDLLGRIQSMNKLTAGDQARLAQYTAAKRLAAEAKSGIDAQVAVQKAAVAEMAKRKQAAQKALAAAGGTPTRSNVSLSGIPTANPAPRNSDGSWPSQSCSLDDPTTSGCITPRTLHALKETKRLGFSWYVSCYRPGSQYEHPKGRACDWATNTGGFVNKSASGANKVYGDRLAAFYVKNAKALGVMYVVWYCQIWQYSEGWHRYNSAGSNCGDDPAPDHTNHVHLSVY